MIKRLHDSDEDDDLPSTSSSGSKPRSAADVTSMSHSSLIKKPKLPEKPQLGLRGPVRTKPSLGIIVRPKAMPSATTSQAKPSAIVETFKTPSIIPNILGALVGQYGSDSDED